MVKINSKEKLNKFIDKTKKSRVLCIDTEFMRENTYYPQLCLVQMQIEKESFILDPFSFETLEPLAEILDDEKILKVFHAAKQDLEILYNETGVVPHPIFDTQLAACVTEGANQISLANVLKSTLNVKIDKSEGFTDWARRPLTDKQLKYAVEDVLFLPELHKHQVTKMKELGRETWLDEEFSDLAQENNYEIDIENRYTHLKHVTKLKDKQLSLAKHLAAWREETAQKKDLPRKRVLSDEQVIEICKRNPKTIDSLFAVRGVQNALSTWEAREVLAALKEGRKCEKKDFPKIDVGSCNQENVDDVVFLMSALVKLRAKENGVAQTLITSNSELTDLARGKRESLKILSGWRKEIVGEELLALLNGKIGITCENNELKILQRD